MSFTADNACKVMQLGVATTKKECGVFISKVSI